MSFIRRGRESFARKNMTEMTTAVATHNLCSLHSKSAIRMPGHSSGDRIEIRGPTTTGLEFMVGCVKGRVTAGAGIDTLGWVVGVILPCTGTFGALFTQDSELLCC